jgi:hypothetical protein
MEMREVFSYIYHHFRKKYVVYYLDFFVILATCTLGTSFFVYR